MGIDAEMLVILNSKTTESDIRDAAADLADAFGADSFYIYRPGEVDWHKNGRHCLEIVETYEQDGPDIIPKGGETFVRVHLATRYYGEGYERGDPMLIIGVAEWLDRRFPGCRVLYGGDSSGVCAEPFGAAERSAMLDHLASKRGRDYRRESMIMRTDDLANPICRFCNRRYDRSGYGQGYGFYSCPGCNDQVFTRDSGVTWQRPKDKRDIFHKEGVPADLKAEGAI